jgi:AcrR family transcriptional regulator
MGANENGLANTRQRVLEAAGEVFADKGFEKATIREIVERAGANLNAVNYYFRDKHGLYVALFEHAYEIVGGKDRDAFARNRHLPPEQRLRAMIAHVLHGFILTKRAPWEARLMLREMIEPTGVMDMMVERFIRPRFEELTAIVRELVPRHVSRLSVQLCAESILGQCAHMAHGRPVAPRLIPDLDYTPQGVEKLTQHIASFSLAAVRNLLDKERIE